MKWINFRKKNKNDNIVNYEKYYIMDGNNNNKLINRKVKKIKI